jgi:hypothetical protein
MQYPGCTPFPSPVHAAAPAPADVPYAVERNEAGKLEVVAKHAGASPWHCIFCHSWSASDKHTCATAALLLEHPDCAYCERLVTHITLEQWDAKTNVRSEIIRDTLVKDRAIFTQAKRAAREDPSRLVPVRCMNVMGLSLWAQMELLSNVLFVVLADQAVRSMLFSLDTLLTHMYIPKSTGE